MQHSATREGLPITIICFLPIMIISRSSLLPIRRIPQRLSINSLTYHIQPKIYEDIRDKQESLSLSQSAIETKRRTFTLKERERE